MGLEQYQYLRDVPRNHQVDYCLKLEGNVLLIDQNVGLRWSDYDGNNNQLYVAVGDIPVAQERFLLSSHVRNLTPLGKVSIMHFSFNDSEGRDKIYLGQQYKLTYLSVDRKKSLRFRINSKESFKLAEFGPNTDLKSLIQTEILEPQLPKEEPIILEDEDFAIETTPEILRARKLVDDFVNGKTVRNFVQ